MNLNLKPRDLHNSVMEKDTEKVGDKSIAK